MWVHKILCSETAFVELIIYEHSGGDYTTQTYELKGTFSMAGAATSAEGDIEQVTWNDSYVVVYSPHKSLHSTFHIELLFIKETKSPVFMLAAYDAIFSLTKNNWT